DGPGTYRLDAAFRFKPDAGLVTLGGQHRRPRLRARQRPRLSRWPGDEFKRLARAVLNPSKVRKLSCDLRLLEFSEGAGRILVDAHPIEAPRKAHRCAG